MNPAAERSARRLQRALAAAQYRAAVNAAEARLPAIYAALPADAYRARVASDARAWLAQARDDRANGRPYDARVARAEAARMIAAAQARRARDRMVSDE